MASPNIACPASGRRAFLAGTAGLFVACRRPLAQAEPFAGTAPGAERIVEGMRFCWCPPGRFLMGSPANERGHRPDEAQVEVTLTHGFWMATFEATQAQWQRVVGPFPDRPPTAEFGIGDDVPVYWVNYHEAGQFCVALTERARRAGRLPPDWIVRLPTEAQWEYACRAGTTTATSFGDDLRLDQANFRPEAPLVGPAGERRDRAVAAGRYPPNRWGLYDMHGNIFEWCRDWYHARLPGGVDPDVSDVPGVRNGDGTYSRVRRGGAWIEEGWVCRSALRLRYEPHRGSDHIGFRVALVEG